MGSARSAVLSGSEHPKIKQLPMRTYLYAEMILASSMALPELPGLTDERSTEAAIVFDMASRPTPRPDPELWVNFPQVSINKDPPAVAKTRSGFVLRFPDTADFTITKGGRRIVCRPVTECSPEVLRHLLLDQVLPRVIAHHGRLVLHAGVFEINGAAIALAGESGHGKSTLVASLSEAGHPALSDDALIVTPEPGGCTCLPLYPTLRLWPDSVAGLALDTNGDQPTGGIPSKRRLPVPKGMAAAPINLPALFILEEEPGVRSVPRVTATLLSRREACIALLRASFQLDIGNPDTAARTLEQAALVAQRLPIFGLSYPREYSLLPEVHEVILEQLRDPNIQLPRPSGPPGLS